MCPGFIILQHVAGMTSGAGDTAMAQATPLSSRSSYSNGENRQQLSKQAYNKRSGEDKSYDIKQSEGAGGVYRGVI